MHRLIVSDLDGTLLGDERSLRTLMGLLRKRGAPTLAFASGRQGASATAILDEWKVDDGTYLIAGVGTELYRRIGKRWMPVAAWPQLQSPWEAERVRRELAAIGALRPQPLPAASAYKLSYFAAPAAVGAVRTRLRAASIDATVVHSHGDLLDVLPSGIDKGSAARWLARRLAISPDRMMTCGNTGNDIAMLALPCASVIVGESDADLLAVVPDLPNAFVARETCAAGIIEGLRFFGWLNGADWLP